jgi:hypothetical protein
MIAKQVKPNTTPKPTQLADKTNNASSKNYLTGKVLVERWNTDGSSIKNLTDRMALKPEPDSTRFITKLESSNKGDNFGLRVTGYLVPPETGTYEMWVDSDDEGQIWLSDNHDKDAIKKLGDRGKRVKVDLNKGKFYAFQVFHKEGGGGDFFKVGWKLPDGSQEFPIPGIRLSNVLPPSHAYKFLAIKPAEAKAVNVPLEIKEDSSILAGGAAKLGDTYTIRFDTNISNMTAIQLYALPDPSLPGKGPGRGSGGMFTIDEIIFSAAARSAPTQFKPVTIATHKVDFAMRGFGLEKALDGKPKTFWGVRGRSGQERIATFVFEKPVGGTTGTILKMTVKNNIALGRFKLLATSYDQPWEIAGQSSLAAGGGANTNPGANPGNTQAKGPVRILVNCGDKTVTDARGNKWVKAKVYKPGSWGWTGGGRVAEEKNVKDELMKTCVLNMDSFRFDVANSKYRVTLLFTDNWTQRGGERVFSTTIQGKTVVEGLDLAKRPGHKKLYKFGPKIYDVKDGKLEIEFSAIVGEALINAIAVESLSK